MEAYINQLFDAVGAVLTTLIISAVPVIELRGAIPVGISMGLEPVTAALLSLIGSMLPVPVILLFINVIFDFLRKTKKFGGIVDKIVNRSMGKSDGIRKYGFWGLVVFVAIPLPGTGVWTGSLIASLLGMKFKTGFFAALLGDICAAVIVTAISSGLFSIFA